ncbi:hypothetical protein Ddye_032071 [Dipteronia dyeriana]|uniref:SET and MYND domain-containing protein 4 n=1 Tax=Dipteronia dyeriana TaxID=168575 RepID=A0AAD9TKI0_9ROSI|nr:hypothetical protein Ddye_032071 [Dipteronia dyeriana]
MEELKSLVPYNLKRTISQSTVDELPSTSSSLLDFFIGTEQFHRIVRDLADPKRGLCGKDKEASLELKRKGNQCYSSGDYTPALSFYTKALRVAPVDASEMDRNLVAMLYVNRANLLHKMNLLVECLRDCNRAIQISPSYAKAWYRRGKVNASLGNNEDAAQDLTIAKNMESSLGGKRQIESELKIILYQSKRTSNRVAEQNEENLRTMEEPLQMITKCVTTPDKGRGMASICDIPQASLVHTEEPYAVIISKHCRETHCHYCLNRLPADAIPCASCSIPLYCSHHCGVQAGGQMFKNDPMEHITNESLSSDLEEYIGKITLGNEFYPVMENIFEHKHECQGVHWPIILPSDIAVAGRVVVKSIEQRRASAGSNLIETLEFGHNYTQMSPESKMESHIFSIVLLYCLQSTYGSELPINGASISKIVVLISQIRVNSMAVVRMKSNDYESSDQIGKVVTRGSALTSNVEQIRVGQAIYRTGSLFNHSCQPNVHAYFLSRTLMIRTTESVVSDCPLELSYGPQVGQWDCKDRLKLLEDGYSFHCQCSGCSEVNISDLLINAFRCGDLKCPGIVLDGSVVICEQQKLERFLGDPKGSSMESHLQVGNISSDLVSSRASLAFEENCRTLNVNPGYCLKCSSYCDLESSGSAVDKAWIYIRRLQDAIVSTKLSRAILLDALRSLGQLRSILHAYNKGIAEAEDKLAQAFCLVGDLQLARDHCKASIEILEKLYGHNHIVIGYELAKLSSIQLSLGDCDTVDSINRLDTIFMRYYGSHADVMFQFLQPLRNDAHKLVQKRQDLI